MELFDLVRRAVLVALSGADGSSVAQLVVDGFNTLWVRGAPPLLVRPIDLTAYWAANPAATELDLTVDPAAPSVTLGPASGIYSVGGGDVVLTMVGSTTASTFTLAAGGSRSVGIVKITKASTTAATVEVSWG